MRPTLLFTALVSTAILSSPAAAHRRRAVHRVRHDTGLSNRALIDADVDVDACIRIGGSADSEGCHSGSGGSGSGGGDSGSGEDPGSGGNSGSEASTGAISGTGTWSAPAATNTGVGGDASGSGTGGGGSATFTGGNGSGGATGTGGSGGNPTGTAGAPGSGVTGPAGSGGDGSGGPGGDATGTAGAPGAGANGPSGTAGASGSGATAPSGSGGGSGGSGGGGAATTAPAASGSGSAPGASASASGAVSGAPGASGSGSAPGISASGVATASGSGAVSGTATATSGAPTATSSVIAYDGEKYAVVHHMLGNTYTYRLADWITDLVLIQEAGFDAVALNTGPDCWQKASADLAYQAAAALNTPLKLYWSFDMNTFPQAGDEDAAKIASYINEYANSPYTFKVNGLPFVSTFSGDQYASSFGKSVCEGWDYVRSLVPTDMYFVPAFFFNNNQTIAGVKDCVQGLFQWNSAWSMDDSEVSKSTDLDWAAQLGANKTYMAGISPTFFSHYPEDGLNKNWVYRADNNYAKRWQQATEINAPMVQVITWNDYGESHYIGPRPSSVQLQPINTTWVNGNNHLPWARITKPYIETYKTGKPAALGSDLIVWEYRTHPAAASAKADPAGAPLRAELLKDEIYVTAYLSAPGEVHVQVGSLEGKFQAKAGMNHFTQPFEPGFVTVGLWRDGENVGGTLTGEREIVAEPTLYDFNPVVEQFWHDPAWEACKA